MIWERKYNEATEVYGVLVKAGAADFKNSPTIAVGDFKISKNDGGFVNLATLPVVSPAGSVKVKFALSAAEMECKTAFIHCADAAGSQWEMSAIVVETHGHASARHLLDRSEAMRGTNSAGTAANLATIATVVAAIKAVTDLLPDSGALSTIGTDTARLTAARAAVLTDWINGGRLDELLDAIPTTAMRGTDSAALASVCTEGRLAELDGANLPTDIAAIPTTAMRGTDSASTHDAAAVVTAMMAETSDGVSLTDILTAGMAVLFGVAVPSDDDVLFKKRDGTTTKVTQTYGTDDGERTGSVIA